MEIRGQAEIVSNTGFYSMLGRWSYLFPYGLMFFSLLFVLESRFIWTTWRMI